MAFLAAKVKGAHMKNVAIREHHLYNKAYRKGKCKVGRLTAVYVLRDYAAERLAKAHPEKKTVNRLGLSVTKKLGGAVERNRAKRIIRAGYDGVKDELRTGFLIVISARTAIVGKSSTEVAKELRRSFSELGMLSSAESEKKENK